LNNPTDALPPLSSPILKLKFTLTIFSLGSLVFRNVIVFAVKFLSVILDAMGPEVRRFKWGESKVPDGNDAGDDLLEDGV
jgi:hypothetical protein